MSYTYNVVCLQRDEVVTYNVKATEAISKYFWQVRVNGNVMLNGNSLPYMCFVSCSCLSGCILMNIACIHQRMHFCSMYVYGLFVSHATDSMSVILWFHSLKFLMYEPACTYQAKYMTS